MATLATQIFHHDRGRYPPSLPIRRGRAGAGLLAHVLVAKFCDHLPLYRQSEIYAREGVELERSPTGLARHPR